MKSREKAHIRFYNITFMITIVWLRISGTSKEGIRNLQNSRNEVPADSVRLVKNKQRKAHEIL